MSCFPYKETPDQSSVWSDISSDLASSSPMDRLLCGDVGFGKTEIAIRAAFRVVLAKKRVVVLAPTTILANQLFSSFSSRLEPSAISVEMVSRFRSKKELSEIKNLILVSKNDVLIGTHALLNNDIYLNYIGLLVIDEEHRFGVRLKEKIRRLRLVGLESPLREFSPENIAFKILRRDGTLEKLSNMKYNVYDKQMSITQE